MEDPLFQDGGSPAASRGALVRLTRFDARSGRPVAQVAYPLERLFEAGPAGSTNGLSDLAALRDGRRLVLLVSDDDFSSGQVTQVIAFAATGI